MSIDAYLERIRYEGPLSRTPETLRSLQVAHLHAVPFENLSIHAGEPIVLDNRALFDKIVVRRRGGFCYELNGLFAALLRELGFDVTMLSAEVMRADGTYGPGFDHMTLLVKLDERWLADVGFGDSFHEPLRFDRRTAQPQGSRAYRIDAVEDGRFVMLQRSQESEWSPQYRFDLEPHVFADYTGMCTYHQTSPDSHFTQKRVITRLTDAGRITLSELRLITTEAGVRRERELASETEYDRVLEEVFGVVMAARGTGVQRARLSGTLPPARSEGQRMQPEIRLQRMSPDEFDAYLERSIRTYAEENVRAGYWSKRSALERSQQAHESLLTQGLETPDNTLYNIEDTQTGQIVGTLWMSVDTRTSPASAFILDIKIRPGLRRKGYGTAALQAIEGEVRIMGLHGIGLHVFNHNQQAIKLYERLGYEVKSVNMLKVLT